jgi:hypothetical protein
VTDVDRLALVVAMGFAGLGLTISATFAPDGPAFLAQAAGMFAPVLAGLATRAQARTETEVVEA